MIRTIVTDIEGTTSSISFVTEVLFPFASEHLDTFLQAHALEPGVASEIDAVRTLAGIPGATLDEVVAVLRQWIREDRKVTPLKALQGMIWASGYADGRLQGHVYDDVPPVLRGWHAQGKRLAVYSSGSVAAQRLIFGHTAHGDLTPLFSAYFDTRIGGKREASSYTAIASELGEAPSSILFLSDVQQELDAACEAGLKVCGLERAARGGLAGCPVVGRFDEIRLDAFH